MSVLQNQSYIATRLSIIEDVQERLAAVVDRARKLPPLADSERVEDNRIEGCVSRVWMLATREADVCRFRIDAESTLVRGLAHLICEVYDGSTSTEILECESDILDTLHLTEQLTSTRRHGLKQVHRAIRDFARGQNPAGQPT